MVVIHMRPMCGDRAAVDSPDVLGRQACKGAGDDVSASIDDRLEYELETKETRRKGREPLRYWRKRASFLSNKHWDKLS